MLRCYEPAHIAGVSKTAYVPATPRCLHWRRDARRRSAPAALVGIVAAARLCSGRRPRRCDVARRPRPRRSTSLAASAVSPLGEADGAVPDGTTVFDDEVPGVAKLDPALLGALRRAATDAAGDGVGFVVDSGWRSPAYQEQLLREAVSKYGSEAEAARWVATPETSAHVSGDAVDIGPSDAAAWLSAHGAAYGLCQIYGNEPWHYELRPEAVDHGCPPMYADPTHDPRMQHEWSGDVMLGRRSAYTRHEGFERQSDGDVKAPRGGDPVLRGAPVEASAVDDVVAETFAIAWRRLPSEAEPLPWLYGVARRVAARSPAEPGAARGADGAADQPPWRRAVRVAFGRTTTDVLQAEQLRGAGGAGAADVAPPSAKVHDLR